MSPHQEWFTVSPSLCVWMSRVLAEYFNMHNTLSNSENVRTQRCVKCGTGTSRPNVSLSGDQLKSPTQEEKSVLWVESEPVPEVQGQHWIQSLINHESVNSKIPEPSRVLLLLRKSTILFWNGDIRAAAIMSCPCRAVEVTNTAETLRAIRMFLCQNLIRKPYQFQSEEDGVGGEHDGGGEAERWHCISLHLNSKLLSWLFRQLSGKKQHVALSAHISTSWELSYRTAWVIDGSVEVSGGWGLKDGRRVQFLKGIFQCKFNPWSKSPWHCVRLPLERSS